VKHLPTATESLRAQVEALGLDLPRTALDRLERYEGLLLDRAVPRGLVARSDSGRLRMRHTLDCLRAARVVSGADRRAYDVGSGAGLPGVVVAIAVPRLEIRLVEPRRVRVAFLELVVEELGLANAEVVAGRIEEQADPADLCFARAFAPLQVAWNAARRVLGPAGRLVYFAGSPADDVAPLAGATSVAVLDEPVLESSGPLIIMSR
jgi:16S rRNA (guanine527-N7)-methyltransferase